MRIESQDQPSPEASPRSETAEAAPVVIRVLQEDHGWFVENAGRIGPFFAKKTATDLAADWVAALRASGVPASVEIVDHFDLQKH